MTRRTITPVFLFHGNAVNGLDRGPDSRAVGGIALREVRDLAREDFLRHAAHGRGEVVEEAFAVRGVEEAEEVAGLRVVVVAEAVVVAVGGAGERERGLGVR